jgi:hypothetical protein
MSNRKKHLLILAGIVAFVLIVSIIMFVFTDKKEEITKEEEKNMEILCNASSVENCPESCSVCPPCEVCSSIVCRSKEFCRSIGFNDSWYKEVSPK